MKEIVRLVLPLLYPVITFQAGNEAGSKVIPTKE